MTRSLIDQPKKIRKGEELNIDNLTAYLRENLSDFGNSMEILQFPDGYSNLTYLIKNDHKEYVLRKPPVGANIKSAHDMGREFSVLSKLKPVYDKIPDPLLFCDDENIIGSPFYIMERVTGLILRKTIPEGLSLQANDLQFLSERAIDNLATLHTLDIESTGLITLGKPDGYVVRQVEGWTERYFNAETEEIPDMNTAAEWMKTNIPEDGKIAFLHNDYKYDNLVLDPESLEIKAVLDWEMSTVGDPLMDLGAALAYWAEPDVNPALKPFNLTWMKGNFDREQVVNRYHEATNTNVEHIVFYYVFGCFKLGVIVQQIYARYKKGVTQDPRFTGLIHVVKACAENAANAIKYNRINNFN
jgi:aminoglycoside phosphotransferase (APT) family kinase protein